MAKKATWIDVDEALQMIMKATGKTRRQAKIALAEACGKGEVQTRVFNEETGEGKNVPSKDWDLVARTLKGN